MGEIILQHLFKKLGRKFRPQRYKAGDILLRPDDPVNSVFYLEKGYVRSYQISREGSELTLIIFKPGDAFPLSSILNNLPNRYYYEALTDVEVWKAVPDDFISFFKSNPDFLFYAIKVLLLRGDGLLRRIESMALGNAYSKVSSTLLLCAKRFGENGKNGTTIKVPFTHRGIASLLGIARETVSLEMKRLEKDGIIAYCDGYILIKDKDKLCGKNIEIQELLEEDGHAL